jgi:hypothetical protein
MDNIIQFERALFSNLQSEFQKLLNAMNKSTNTSTLKKILVLNEQMRLLENMMYELKIDIYSNNTSLNSYNKELLDDHSKNQDVIDKFKPLMLYYRFLLN